MTSLYDLTFPTLINAIKTTQNLVGEAESHSVSTSELADTRLAPDMWPLNQQVSIIALHATVTIAKLTGTPASNQVPFGPSSLEDGKKYLAETLKSLEAVKPEDVNGKENETVGAMMGAGNEIQLKAVDYVQGYLLPNVFFHVTTAYNILRSKGAPLGKAKYLGAFLKPIA